MCNPALAMLAITTASTALEIKRQDDQADAINDAAAQQDENIRKATVQNFNQLNRQGVEDAQNHAVEQQRISREMASRVATGRAQAGASGVGGLSVDAMLLNLAGKGLEAQTTSEMNYARTMAARQDQATEIEMNARGQLAGVQWSPGVGAAEYMGAGLKIGGAYAQYKKETTPKVSTSTSGSTGP